MPLDPHVQAYLDLLASAGEPSQHTISVEEARVRFLGLAALTGEPLVVGSVENREIPGPESQIPVRIYTPEGKGPFPLLVYFHAVAGYLAILMYTTRYAGRLPTLLAVSQCRLTIAWPQSTSTRQRRGIVTQLLAGWRRTPTVSTAILRASLLAVIAQVATWRRLSR